MRLLGSLRRTLMGALWIVTAALSTLLSPLLGVLAALGTLLTRNRQPLRLVHFLLIYLLREAAVLIACALLWLASGLGRRLGRPRFQALHYRLMEWLLDGVLQPVLRSLSIDVDAAPTDAAGTALCTGDGPLILFSRHAGPGDSFLVVDQMLVRYGRRPRIVMKRSLAHDPALGVLCHRLPNALLDTDDRDECERQIAALSAGLGGRDVLVLFPEGGNYTPERRRKAIRSLRRRGQQSQAAKAEQMTHVMPPKTAGALAALDANPGADVIFAAHTGLGHEAFPLQMWRNPPVGKTVRMRMWLAPADQRPAGEEAQTEWLFGWWKRLDEWIDGQGEQAG